MERIRHHLNASHSTTLRAFFASDNVDFGPRSRFLRENVQKAKCKFVTGLADGGTSREEEIRIRDTIAKSIDAAEVAALVAALEGWEGLDDELEPDDLDQIAVNIAQVLDQKDYPVYWYIRRHLAILSFDVAVPGPTLGDAAVRVLSLPPSLRKGEINKLLNKMTDILRAIEQAVLRARPHMVRAAGVSVAVIQAYESQVPPVHRRDELLTFFHRVAYTIRIATGLELRQYADLYNVLVEMADGTIDVRRRQAARDTVEAMGKAFLAVERAVQTFGPNEARATVARFMAARQAALDAFDFGAGGNTVLNAIAAAIGSVAATIADLRTAIVNLPDTLGDTLTLSGFLDEDGDDKARTLVNTLFGLGALGQLPTRIKVEVINACLDGFTDDDDEQAILKVLRAAKEINRAEVWQLEASATWEALDFSIDGDENDELVAILANLGANP